MPVINLRLGALCGGPRIARRDQQRRIGAQRNTDTGASDTEIKIGNIMPYSGPASAYGVIGKTEEAYFRKINAEGGIQRPQDQLRQL
jgi:branched-chain amino acid transport system substrate-binding protein